MLLDTKKITNTRKVLKEYKGEEVKAGVYKWRIEGTKNFRDSIDKRVCSKYVDDMYKGDVFPLLYLDYKKKNQEGRHRAFAAWILGIKKIPVLVIKKTLQEKLSRIFLESSGSKTLISVDIQPEYYYKKSKYGGFRDDVLNGLIELLNSDEYDKKIVFYNGHDTLGMIEEGEYISWLIENGLEEDRVNEILFYDKGYAFFRFAMDSGIDEDDIVDMVKGDRYELFNHSYSHSMNINDLEMCQNAVFKRFGLKPNVFGAPYNSLTDATSRGLNISRLVTLPNMFFKKSSIFLNILAIVPVTLLCPLAYDLKSSASASSISKYDASFHLSCFFIALYNSCFCSSVKYNCEKPCQASWYKSTAVPPSASYNVIPNPDQEAHAFELTIVVILSSEI
jgi:hypothetical protein